MAYEIITNLRISAVGTVKSYGDTIDDKKDVYHVSIRTSYQTSARVYIPSRSFTSQKHCIKNVHGSFDTLKMYAFFLFHKFPTLNLFVLVFYGMSFLKLF